MDSTPTLALSIPRGVPWSLEYTYTLDQGSNVWVAGRDYELDAVVTPGPNNIDPFPPIDAIYFLATNAGTSGATPPAWPTSFGQTVVDNPGASQITWKAQDGSSYVVDITGWSAQMDFLRAPDDPNPPILSLTQASGIVITGPTGLIVPSLTPTQIETLLAASDYGFHRLKLTPVSGPAVRVLKGPWAIEY